MGRGVCRTPSRRSSNSRAVLAAIMVLSAVPLAGQEERVPIEEIRAAVEAAALTPGGLVEALYGMVSFGPGPEPDWEMFRDVFLNQAVIVFSPRGSQPMRVMSVDGFMDDWRAFFRDADLENHGFYETIASMKVDEFGGLAHAWVVFEPRVGEARRDPQIRGLDSIELSFDGRRWWVAAITTDFEGPGQEIPDGLVPPGSR